MKNLITICLFFLSIGLMAQTKPKVDIVTKQGTQLKCKVISMDKQKIQIERADGRTGIASSETIESINGMTYEEFYEMYKDGISETVSFPLNDSGEIEYTEVVQVGGIDSKELFVRAKEWLALTFVSSESVIEFEDKEAGKIIGNGNIDAIGISQFVDYGIVKFRIEIQVKDNRYKYSFNNIRHKKPYTHSYYTPEVLTEMKAGGGINTMGQKSWDSIRSNAYTDLGTLIESLKAYMTRTSDRSSDDW